MEEVSIVGVDLRPCVVAMEACGTAHYWGREFASMGHDVRLIPPVYVKAFVKRQKNDVADAEAVAEAAMRPTMRTVAVKTSEQQARAMLFRTRDLLVGQRTQMVNALRGHLAEHGIIVGKGLGNVERLATLIAADDLPELVRTMGRLYLSQITQLHEEIDQIDRRIAAEAKQSDIVRRLQKVPGIGPICAMAITAFAPPMEAFRSGRDFAAWLGLVPRQHSSGGKQKLGRTSKMGQRDIRRLLIIGAMSVVHWKGCRLSFMKRPRGSDAVVSFIREKADPVVPTFRVLEHAVHEYYLSHCSSLALISKCQTRS
jgi:transposase